MIKKIGRIIYLYGIVRVTLSIVNLFFVIPGTRFSSVGIDVSSLYITMFLGGTLGLAFSIGYLFSGKGILKLKKWGPALLINILVIQRLFDIFYKFCSTNCSDTEFFVNLGLFVQGLNLALAILIFSPFYFLFLAFNIAVLTFVIYFFTRANVKEQFN